MVHHRLSRLSLVVSLIVMSPGDVRRLMGETTRLLLWHVSSLRLISGCGESTARMLYRCARESLRLLDRVGRVSTGRRVCQTTAKSTPGCIMTMRTVHIACHQSRAGCTGRCSSGVNASRRSRCPLGNLPAVRRLSTATTMWDPHWGLWVSTGDRCGGVDGRDRFRCRRGGRMARRVAQLGNVRVRVTPVAGRFGDARQGHLAAEGRLR